MSLTVPPDLLEQAQNGKVTDEAFLDCIRTSLPYAWEMVARLVGELRSSGVEFVKNTDAPPNDEAWGQMFRMMSSDAMRNVIQRHFEVRLAFQNCHGVAVFDTNAHKAHERYTSPEAQLLNQHPSLINC